MLVRQPIVEVKGLCKAYLAARTMRQLLTQPWGRAKRMLALDHVSFSLEAGQVVGVLGLNGAGKTTLLKSLCNLLEPSRGRITIEGHTLPQSGAIARSIIGYVPSDERSFFWRLGGRANLQFFAGLYGLEPRAAQWRISSLLEQFGLSGRAEGHFANYSSGMRKRLAIVRGLLHDPRVLILDEPTNSLDMQWDRFLQGFVRQWVRAGSDRLVVWSTHRAEEVCNVCDHVIGLRTGRLVYTGDPAGALRWIAPDTDGNAIGSGACMATEVTLADSTTHCPVKARHTQAEVSNHE